MHFKTFLLSLVLTLTACGKSEKVQVLSSLPNTDSLLIETEIPVGKKLKEDLEIIRISSSDSCQTVLGVGAALTHASAWVLHHNLTPIHRDSVLRELFTPQGIGINYTRLCVGLSQPRGRGAVPGPHRRRHGPPAARARRHPA